jgi:hypothetical protein
LSAGIGVRSLSSGSDISPAGEKHGWSSDSYSKSSSSSRHPVETLTGISGTLFTTCSFDLLVFIRLFLATFFTLFVGFSIFTIDISGIARNEIRIRSDIQKMLPNCSAVITVT